MTAIGTENRTSIEIDSADRNETCSGIGVRSVFTHGSDSVNTEWIPTSPMSLKHAFSRDPDDVLDANSSRSRFGLLACV
ncbi:hypothetical protein EVAR_75441_1 [Eumeta japonica]|uniref:Uncharacterized protein n=1 Tax=Eumeta variegata TaxID=151549 RepID=A0A4C1TMY1_EUMVA|nr:hypothetical protein EVAR_75441_1 [Eumeta japonica]